MKLSRRTILTLARVVQSAFSSTRQAAYSSRLETIFEVDDGALTDFLFEAEIDDGIANGLTLARGPRALQEFIMVASVNEISGAPGGTPFTLKLAEAVLRAGEHDQVRFVPIELGLLQGFLELDGYVFRDRRLLPQDKGNVIDVEQAQDLITQLYVELKFSADVMKHHLKNSEELFLAGKWDLSIGECRKVLEETLTQVALAFATKVGPPLTDADRRRPAWQREYLEKQGVLEKEERRAYDGAYGLLSHTGGHPYIAEPDQARLLRQVALTYTQFVLLQWQGHK